MYAEHKLWDIVGSVVEARGRKLVKYKFFEKLWGALEESGIVILRAPTGAGKTEAALAPFLYSSINGERTWSNVIYALPTRSLVGNMHARACKACEAIRDEGKVPKLVVTYDYGGFFIGKPFLEGDLVFTTYDTLLFGFYGFRALGHHLLLALGKIASSLAILDEIQLLQDAYWYSPSLIPHHIINMAEVGANIVVMSATIPSALVDKIREGAEQNSIPITYITSVDMPSRGKLEVEFKHGPLLDALNWIDEIERPALLVFNTVERAVKAYEMLRKKGFNAHLLHSRLRSGERKARESIFEKNKAGEAPVVVSTQVVEAGLDYDFRSVLTEVAPVDALVQRLGRCARREDGNAVIFTDVELTAGVYPEPVIKRTIEIISESELARSTVDATLTTKLVDSVYEGEVINELSKNVNCELRKAIGYIKTFLHEKLLIDKKLYEDIAHTLLRLGIEINSVLLNEEDYKRVKLVAVNLVRERKQEEDVAEDRLSKPLYEYVENSMVSLSLPHGSKAVRLPAIEHDIEGKSFYVLLTPLANNAFRVVVNDKLKTLLRPSTSSRSVFLLSPESYRVYFNGQEIGWRGSGEGYEVGVVKPYAVHH